MKNKKIESSIFNGIRQGLEQALAHSKGKAIKGTKSITIRIAPLQKYTAADIRKLRNKVGLSQVTLAEIIGVNRRTVEAWESGQNSPSGPAMRLLELIDKQQDDIVDSRLYQFSEV